MPRQITGGRIGPDGKPIYDYSPNDIPEYGVPYGSVGDPVRLANPEPASSVPSGRFSIPKPNWAPGEFEEWKHSQITGIPTRFGSRQQRRWNVQSNPLAVQQIDQQEQATPDNALRVASNMNRSEGIFSLPTIVNQLDRTLDKGWEKNVSPALRGLLQGLKF